MTKDKLKNDFHKLIDNIDDVKKLEYYFKVLSEFIRVNEADIVDELNENQKARLMDSIEQVSDKDIVDNEKMKEEIKSWLIK